jgi:hypothetical protein
MKRITAILCAMMFVVAAVAMATDPTASKSAAPASTWFDMKTCAFCAPMMSEKGLMEHMTWDVHPIATGMVGVCTVDPAFEEAYQRAHASMMGLVGKAMAGEKMNMCGHCSSMMAMGAAGAKMENVDSKNVHLMMVTSTDPKIIEMAHAHAARDTEEMAKMMAMEEEKQ